jgi:phospholipid transport system substrate-binding protein
MKMTRLYIRGTALASMALLVAATASAAPGAGSPLAILKSRTDEVAAMLKHPTAEGTPAHARKKARVKKIVRSFLAYDELAKQALHLHWEKRTKAERQEFVDLLRQLIEDRVLSNLSSQVDFTVEYGETKVEGDRAVVKTTVQIPNKPEVDIEYKFTKKGNRWLVYDLITDNTSLVRNYRSQFNRIIQRDGYQALVQKMRDKLHNREASSGKLANAATAG